jgi:alpha-tubulin suppressor-like RCC1 family protein
MTIGVKTLVDCVNNNISNTAICQPLQILQLSSVSKDFDAGFVYSVANCAALPAAADNKGRMIYLQDTCTYRISDGVLWTNDFSSEKKSLIFSWGSNVGCMLGDGTSINRSSPVSIVGGFTDWCQVATGANHGVALKTNGTVWSWGCGSSGQLGNGTIANKLFPTLVVGGFTDWCQISAGSALTLALRTNGTLWAWGFNSRGQIGDDTIVARSSPVSVVGGFTDWCRVSAGGAHSFGIRCGGSLWAWGYNFCGRLGDGTVTSRLSPVQVCGGFSWCTIDTQFNHAVAIRNDGTVWNWGFGAYGKLGTNNVTDRSSPVSVLGGFTDWCQAAAGRDFNHGIRTNGTLWTWGRNNIGQLGNDTATTCNRSSPVSVVGGFTDWCQVDSSNYHSVALRANGTAWSWGANQCGQLGHNTATTCNRSSPVSVLGGFTDWAQVSASMAANSSMGLRKLTKGF